MNFRPELALAVLEGRKTVTRRLVSENPRSPWYHERCSLKVGKTYAICPGRGKPAAGYARVTAVELVPLGHLSNAEARAEGFENSDAFHATWMVINGWRNSDPLMKVWKITLQATSSIPRALDELREMTS